MRRGDTPLRSLVNVLAVCVPAPGHLNPLLPLLRSFRAQGDRVVVASAPDVADSVIAAGLEHVEAGYGEQAWFSTLAGRVRGVPGDGLPPRRILHYFIPRLFAEVAASDMVDDVLARARELHPDVLVFESYAFAAPLAARLLEIPAVHHCVGAMLDHDVVDLANDALSPLWRSLDAGTPRHAGLYDGVTIAICPPSVDPRQVPSGSRLLLRPSTASPSRPPADGRPLVYATLGTFFDNVDVLRTVVEGLGDQPVDVVVTVGADRDPAALGRVPGNVRVERYIPQAELMPQCAAVVHHGGSGTMLGALAHGLPQLSIPQGADNFVNAALLEQAGVGTTLHPGEVTAGSVRDAVNTLLSDSRYTEAAASVAADLAAMPGPDEVASALRARLRDGASAGGE